MEDREKAVKVYDAANEIDAGYLQGMLESEGIDSMQLEQGLEGYFNISPLLGSNILTGGIQVCVREKDRERAEAVVKDFLGGKGEEGGKLG